jgi:PAS domain S-box-containing protein
MPDDQINPLTSQGAEGMLSRLDLEAIVGALPILLFVMDADDVFTGFRIGGDSAPFVPPEQFLGRRVLEVLPEHPGRELAAALARARASGAEVRVEYSLPMPTGLQAFEARIVPLDTGRLAILVLEVTERVQAREQLAARLRQQSAVARLGQTAVSAVDLQELLDAAVRVLAETLDVEYAKVLELEPEGKSLLLRAGHGWRPGLVGCARVGTGESSQAGHTLRSDDAVMVLDLGSDGRFRGPPLLREHGVVSGLSVVIPGRDGVYGVLGAHTSRRRMFTTDETLLVQTVANIVSQAVERQRILVRLRENEERFRLLINRSADLIAVFTIDGVIQFMSASVEGILGFRPEEMVGRFAFEFVHPEDREAAAQSLSRLSQTAGSVVRVTMRHLHRDGSYRILESSGINLMHIPAVGGIVVNSRDATERRNLEEQLNQSQRLESVGRLAGGMAHDLNNILTAILGNAELLNATLPAGAGASEELAEITRSSLRARDLVQQLLAFARKQVLAPKVLDLNQSVRNADRLLRRLLREDIALQLHLTDPLWPVTADPAQLEQVLINLAVNARDAMPEGGTLSIETANVDLDAGYAGEHAGTVEPGPHVMIAVNDTGVGMPPGVLAHVFEPFYTTKPQGAGTGLGLATTYGIVKQSGGHVYAYSEPGVGTTFKIYLPRAREPVPEAVVSAAAVPRGGTETLLLVEDNEAVRSVAQRVLARAGYRVLVVATPEAAMALEAGFPEAIHLLITDVVMAGLSGRQVAEELSRRRPGLRVLYISGYTENAIVHHGLVDPGTWFLAKPFTGITLAAKVREVLDAG